MPSVAVEFALPRLTDAQQTVPWAKHLVESLQRFLHVYAVTLNGMGTGGSGALPVVETFSGPLSAFPLSQPSLGEIVLVNGVGLQNTVEYAVAGSTVTPTRAISAGEWAEVIYWTTGAPAYQAFAGPASTLTLAVAPQRLIVVVNGVGLRLVASAPGNDDFTLSGVTVTLGRSIGASEKAWVYSWA